MMIEHTFLCKIFFNSYGCDTIPNAKFILFTLPEFGLIYEIINQEIEKLTF